MGEMLIVAILIIGGIYLMSKRRKVVTPEVPPEVPEAPSVIDSEITYPTVPTAPIVPVVPPVPVVIPPTGPSTEAIYQAYLSIRAYPSYCRSQADLARQHWFGDIAAGTAPTETFRIIRGIGSTVDKCVAGISSLLSLVSQLGATAALSGKVVTSVTGSIAAGWECIAIYEGIITWHASVLNMKVTDYATWGSLRMAKQILTENEAQLNRLIGS